MYQGRVRILILAIQALASPTAVVITSIVFVDIRESVLIRVCGGKCGIVPVAQGLFLESIRIEGIIFRCSVCGGLSTRVAFTPIQRYITPEVNSICVGFLRRYWYWFRDYHDSGTEWAYSVKIVKGK